MKRARVAILLLAGALLVLSIMLVRPFLEFFLLAVLLAYPLRPLQVRLSEYTDPRIAAGSLVFGATVAIILPTLLLARVVVQEAIDFHSKVQNDEITFTEVEAQIEELTGREVDFLDTAQRVARESGIGGVDSALGLFGTVTSLLIGLGLTMFLLYYFLKDADRFNRWLRATVPLPEHVHDELKREFDDVMWAVLASHVLIAVVQGVVAGAGLWVLGIPSAAFWTAVMVFLAVLPIIGSFLVWGPAAVYLFSVGDPIAGGVLLVYGAVVVSFCDDFLRPIVIDRYTETRLNPGAILIGVLGGVYLFGFIGIFFGPVLIGSLRAVLDIYRREYVQPTTAGDAAGDESPAGEAEGDAAADRATAPIGEPTDADPVDPDDPEPIEAEQEETQPVGDGAVTDQSTDPQA
jgi:predicted PurR-regulated permease PerM